jgi:hypothetical protein
MEKYPKLFLKAGLVYLGMGVLLGVLMSWDIVDSVTFRFVHFHLNLLGFMAMTIIGVAYHILPRFNGKPIPHPSWLPLQFVLMNAGLIGMVLLFVLGGYWEQGLKSVIFGSFSLMAAASIFLFIFNVFPILVDPPPIVVPAQAPVSVSLQGKPGQDKVAGNMKVAAVLDTWPDIVHVFVEHGFKALANPVAKAAFARMITISMACKIHHVDESKFLAALNGFVKDSDKAPPPVAPESQKVPVSPAKPKEPDTSSLQTGGKEISRGERCTGEVLVGKLLETYPETRKIFEKHYGAACFSCPGQAFETITQTASMHNADLNMILGEINAEIDKALK